MLNCLGVASRGSRPFFRPLAILVLARLRQATTHSFPLLRLVERGRDERHVYLALFLRGRSGAFLKEQQSPETCILKSSLEQFGEYPRDAFFPPSRPSYVRGGHVGSVSGAREERSCCENSVFYRSLLARCFCSRARTAAGSTLLSAPHRELCVCCLSARCGE